MTYPVIQLDEADYFWRFPLRCNPRSGDEFFETYGDDLAFIRRQNPRTIWTLIDDDHGGQYILSGLRTVNRIGLYVSVTPAPEGACIVVLLPKNSSPE